MLEPVDDLVELEEIVEEAEGEEEGDTPIRDCQEKIMKKEEKEKEKVVWSEILDLSISN